MENFPLSAYNERAIKEDIGVPLSDVDTRIENNVCYICVDVGFDLQL